MPRKPKKTRQRKPRTYRRRYRRSQKNKINSYGLVFKPSLKQHNPFPPRYRTKLYAEFFGYSASGAGTGDINFAMKLNAARLPFNGLITSLTPNNIAFNTYNPAGYSDLISIYQQYKITGCALHLDVVSQSVADPVTVTITPSNNNASPSNVANAMAQPWTVTGSATSGRPTTGTKTGYFRSYIDVAKMYGLYKKAVLYDGTGLFSGDNTTDPNNLLFWVVNIETGDNAIFASAIEVRVRLIYYIEFFATISADTPQT